jgi:hypothetical protein
LAGNWWRNDPRSSLLVKHDASKSGTDADGTILPVSLTGHIGKTVEFGGEIWRDTYTKCDT